MNDYTIFTQLCDLWRAHFETMLTCVTILMGFFGIGCPLLFSFFQRRNLKEERELFNKEMEKKVNEIKEQKELLLEQKIQIEELKDLLSNSYIALTDYYSEALLHAIESWNHEYTEEKKQNTLRRILDYFGKALQCLANSQNKKELIEMLDVFANADRLSNIILGDIGLLKKTVDNIRQQNPTHNFLVTSEDLAEIAGSENRIYKNFVSKFKILFDMVDLYYS